MAYGFDFDEIVTKIVAEQHKELLEEVEFWKEQAWINGRDKKTLQEEVYDIQKKLSEKEEDGRKAETLLSIMVNLPEEEMLKVLKKSIGDNNRESYDTPLFMSILLDNPEIAPELIEKMKVLSVKLPMNIENFVHPTNYTKEQLLEVAKEKRNFYVTNGNLFSSNYSYFNNALKSTSFRFHPDIDSLPLQLLLKNKLFLDDEVFDAFLANPHISKYMFNLTIFHDIPYQKVLKLLPATESKLEKLALLGSIEKYHDRKEIQDILLLYVDTSKWSNVNIKLLTNENKVVFFKRKAYKLEEIVEICHDFKFSEETLQYILKNLLK